MCTYGTTVSIHTSYELPAINDKPKNTGIHTIHTTGVGP